MQNKTYLIGQVGNSEFTYTFNTDDIDFSQLELLNAITQTAILTTLGAYKLCQQVQVNNEFGNLKDVKQFAKFLSYVVNHPVFAPVTYNLKVMENYSDPFVVTKIEQNQYDSVITFSGGIDSTAGLLFLLDSTDSVLPLSVSFGQRNDEAESSAIKKVLDKLKMKPFIITLNINKYILEGWESWSHIIPARNFLFLSFAATIASYSAKNSVRLYLCAHKDEMVKERNTDKSEYFLQNSANYFSQYFLKSYKCLTPFYNMDKTQVLSYWRRNWVKKYNLTPYDTTTCYYEKGCGECDACLKRTISLLAAGFREDRFMKKHPFSDPAGIIKKSWLPMIQENKLSEVRLLDLLIAIKRTDKSMLRSYLVDLSENMKHLKQKQIERLNSIKTVHF